MASDLSDKVVTITLNATGLPVPDVNRVEAKKDTQKVKWCADFDFSIEFEDYGDVKKGTGGNGCRFTWKTGKFTEARVYKYSIKANGQTNDPEVEIKP